LEKGDCRPIFCEVNLTNKCNLRCKWCISENFKRDNQQIQSGAFLQFVKEFAQYGGKAITLSGGGEPTQHKDFVSIVRRSAKYVELGLMTNGAYNNGFTDDIAENFKWVRISLDTLDPYHYKIWKGVNKLPAVIKNIKDLIIADKTKVGINCNIHPDFTIREVDDLVKFLDENKLHYLQFRPIIPRYYKKEKFEYNCKVWEYIFALNHKHITISGDKFVDLTTDNLFPFQGCWGHLLNFVVDCNGDVCVCMYRPNDDRFVFGNISLSSFSDIWNSQQRKDVIRFVTQQLDIPNECQACCKLCELNKAFTFINKSHDTMDINFL
jgi:radical SAM protein with 4Fe4S-binding SPASM domain